MILPGGFTNMVLEFNIDTCRFRKLEAFDEILNRQLKNEQNNELSFTTCNLMQGSYFYFINKNEILYSYNFDTEVTEKVCDIESKFEQSNITRINDNFIKMMIRSESSDIKRIEKGVTEDGQAGKRIYDFLKDVYKN
jgi:hypothetical protein